ncbi:glycosyltransferase [Caballeronia sp. Lep1P3]|uniref:glycosyltransferase n=1 Tax=Caballeronia sp. Lep1P3 TaxID=2878150 RepID=UPI001FD1C228|nr:glycosyltransferase [Caballeronia sp. Lep1P3]
MDTTRRFYPGGVALTQEKQDRTRHPLEYLFTEANASVVGYGFDAAGEPVVLRGSNVPQNAVQIKAMQHGILDFIGEYLGYSGPHRDIRPVSGYVAITPLWLSIKQNRYTFDVYKDFLYDAAPVLFGKSVFRDFGDLFSEFKQDVPLVETVDAINGRILFVTPELIYTGALHSLLRICKVAISLGYAPLVWSAKAGNFEQEFKRLGIPVEIVDAKVAEKRIKGLIASGVKLAVCNTVVTDRYVRCLERAFPVVWYVREATNLPDFVHGNAERAVTLKSNQNIVCVSEYAAAAIRKFSDGPIEVVPNSTEDRSGLALPYTPRSGGKHKFVQLGTIEYRKGYDLFIMAYRSMPQTYRDRAELHFAGGFINSGTSFASYVFSLADGDPGIHFHGLIEDEGEKIGLISRMDTVVVASRDESFSLVAIEGAMLSKPVIVSTNVGAKYLIDDASGRIVESGNIAALRDAMIAFIDLEETELVAMGAASRRQYDEYAGMDAHCRDLDGLFSRRIAKGPSFDTASPMLGQTNALVEAAKKQPLPEVIVSMTSYPPRMGTSAACVASLLKQTMVPSQVQLWLSKDQFPKLDADLPAELLALVGKDFRIHWVEGDLGPHKKYFYAMRQFPTALIITVDDDVIYEPNLVETLVNAHREDPRAIICNRANLVLFRKSGELRSYDGWLYDYRYLRGRPTYQLLPTGIGGVLYPPGAVPARAFDADAVAATCWHGDDLWLKAWTTASGYPVRMPQTVAGFKQIEGSQAVGLWRENVFQGVNDRVFAEILTFFGEYFGARDALLARIRGIRPDGSFAGEFDASDRMSIFPKTEQGGKL